MILSPRATRLLAVQQEKYLRSLPGKRVSIKQCWDQIQSEGATQANIEQLKLLVHRLSGSAGSYGFHQLGEAAQKLDRILDSSDGSAFPLAETSDAVQALLTCLE